MFTGIFSEYNPRNHVQYLTSFSFSPERTEHHPERLLYCTGTPRIRYYRLRYAVVPVTTHHNLAPDLVAELGACRWRKEDYYVALPWPIVMLILGSLRPTIMIIGNYFCGMFPTM
jgi:hypothetical protein